MSFPECLKEIAESARSKRLGQSCRAILDKLTFTMTRSFLARTHYALADSRVLPDHPLSLEPTRCLPLVFAQLWEPTFRPLDEYQHQMVNARNRRSSPRRILLTLCHQVAKQACLFAFVLCPAFLGLLRRSIKTSRVCLCEF